MSGGLCHGPLVVERGNPIGSLIATLGLLPPATPAALASAPPVVEVSSEFCEATGGVKWARFFPPSCRMGSRWYWDEKKQLAVDSFTYLGIPDFGELGRVGQSWASSGNRIIIVITRNGD